MLGAFWSLHYQGCEAGYLDGLWTSEVGRKAGVLVKKGVWAKYLLDSSSHLILEFSPSSPRVGQELGAISAIVGTDLRRKHENDHDHVPSPLPGPRYPQLFIALRLT